MGCGQAVRQRLLMPVTAEDKQFFCGHSVLFECTPNSMAAVTKATAADPHDLDANAAAAEEAVANVRQYREWAAKTVRVGEQQVLLDMAAHAEGLMAALPPDNVDEL